MPGRALDRIDPVLSLCGLRLAVGQCEARTRAGDHRPGNPRMSYQTRLVQVRTNILRQNDVIARRFRQRFDQSGVYVVSLVSSPGAGKTMFLEQTLTLLRDRSRVAALVGDLATENDARRLSRSGAPIKQITTGTVCHLEAEMVESCARGLADRRARLSFYRKRRQPGLSCELRSRRSPPIGALLGHRGRRQTSKISDHL